MNNKQPKTVSFPFPPTLVAVDAIAMASIAICLMELFPKHGQPLGLIPLDWIWPLLSVSAVVAFICAILIVRMVFRQRTENPTANGDGKT